MIFLDNNLEKIIKEVKSMDKSKRKQLLDSISRDPKAMEQLTGLLQNPDIQSKLKDFLK